MGRHEGPPLGSAAREATAMPYVGKRREHCCTHPGTGICMCDCHDWDCRCSYGEPDDTWLDRIDEWLGEPDDPPRCGSCGHVNADDCGCLCCTDDHLGGLGPDA